MNPVINHYFKNNFFTKRIEKKIIQFSKMDQGKLLENYNSEFLRLFRSAIKFSSFYQRLYSKWGITEKDIYSVEDIEKLPTIKNQDIKNNYKDISCGYDLFGVKGYTSGTTGTPLTLKRNFFSIVKEQAYINFYRSSLGFVYGEPLLSLRGKLGKNKLFEKDPISNTLYISTPSFNKKNALFVYDLISKFMPMAVEGYPSYLNKISDEFEMLGLRFNIPFTFTSSETLNIFFINKIKRVLNTEIYDWYGNAERSILLAQNKKFEYQPLPLYSINEFKDNHVVTTSLINNTFPLIRYRVDDIIKTNKSTLLQNIIHPNIIAIDGRASETIKLRDGSEVGCIDYIFKEIDHLEMAQVYQMYPGEDIDIKLVTNEQFGIAEQTKLLQRARRLLGDEVKVNIIPSTKADLVSPNNGKYRLIIKGKYT